MNYEGWIPGVEVEGTARWQSGRSSTAAAAMCEENEAGEMGRTQMSEVSGPRLEVPVYPLGCLDL